MKFFKLFIKLIGKYIKNLTCRWKEFNSGKLEN